MPALPFAGPKDSKDSKAIGWKIVVRIQLAECCGFTLTQQQLRENCSHESQPKRHRPPVFKTNKNIFVFTLSFFATLKGSVSG